MIRTPWKLLWWLIVFPTIVLSYLITRDPSIVAWATLTAVVVMGVIGVLIMMFSTYVGWMREQVQKEAESQVQAMVQTWENERERESD